jgi:hypothetical protein
MSVALGNQGDDLTSVVPVNREIAPEILVVRANRVIGRETLVVRAVQVIDQVTLEDRDVREIERATLVDRGVREIDPATLVDRASPVEILSKIFRVAFAIGKDGRIGAKIIATISATGGTTTPATSMIGSTTIGGTITTSTGRTTRASVTGVGPLGRR